MSSTLIDRQFMELIAPRQDTQDLDGDFAKFEERYRLFLEHDTVISITDNPMSHLSFMAPEMIDVLGLPVRPENAIVHLNTFHRKTDEKFEPGKEQNEQDLDILLQHALRLGIRYLLCVSGDGSDKFPSLEPQDLGFDPRTVKRVTSVQLMEYIGGAYPGRFTCGVAFNQYEPAREEMEKLERKHQAGAGFIITQPVSMKGESDARIVEANRNLDAMMKYADQNGMQVILEAWMSKKLAHLMPECVGVDIRFGDFDPWANLRDMHARYPDRKCYFSMIFGEQGLIKALEAIGA
ncbi:methylenetetrahydrofolate reductase [bacterium]|nr:methylenetetrahydrofolate reductase [bacterium]